jgi:hypothetical protein
MLELEIVQVRRGRRAGPARACTHQGQYHLLAVYHQAAIMVRAFAIRPESNL